MLKYLFVIALNIFCFATKAQIKRDTIIYPMAFASDSLFAYPTGTWVDDVKKANGFRLIISPDTIPGSPLFIVNDCYLNGDMRFRGKSTKKDSYVFLDGPCISYYSNREPKEIVTYNMSRRIGEAQAFYPDGKLYFSGKYNDKNEFELYESHDRSGKIQVDKGNGEFAKYDTSFTNITDRGHYENAQRTGEWKHYINDSLRYSLTYKDGKAISGLAYNKDGKTTPFTKMRSSAEYKDGVEGFYKFITSRIHYTERAKQAKAGGRSTIQFIVNEDGSITDIKILRSVGYGLDEQAVDVIKLTSKQWNPAIEYGLPVRSRLTIPLNFGLEMLSNPLKFTPRQTDYNLNGWTPPQ